MIYYHASQRSAALRVLGMLGVPMSSRRQAPAHFDEIEQGILLVVDEIPMRVPINVLLRASAPGWVKLTVTYGMKPV